MDNKTNVKTNGSFQNQPTRDIGDVLKILQLNIEGVSRSKADYLLKILNDHSVDVVLLQETHCADETQLRNRCKLPGFALAAATYHTTYGTATYVRNNIEAVNNMVSTTVGNMYVTRIKISNMEIINLYKPPAQAWNDNTIRDIHHPAIIMGDFNCHSTQWGYNYTNQDGEEVSKWAETQNTFLIYDPKDRGTFHSARWGRDYSPDLCFVTKDVLNKPLRCNKKVLSDFPRSQHRPVLLNVGTQIPLIRSIPKPRWNFGKADWESFTSELEFNIQWIPPKAENYGRFVGLLLSTARKHVPRGYRKTYIPGWSQKCTDLYNEYLENADPDVADELLQYLDTARRERWHTLMNEMSFEHSSRKAWHLLSRLGATSMKTLHNSDDVSPNDVANRILKLTRRTPEIDKKKTREIRAELNSVKGRARETDASKNFETYEISKAIKDTKTGKAAGIDGIYPEFLKHCGPNALRWLTEFFNNIVQTGSLPTVFKRTKIIAILKPGKTGKHPEDFRPIALLSVCYKLLERLILNRIKPIVEEKIPVEQAGFRPKRSCSDQVLAVATHIERGFEEKKKSTAVFIDLSSAYDTVWRQGMLLKFLRFIPCKKLATLLNNMLANRHIEVHLNGKKSRTYQLNNGLPQGSVLSPLLFNIYTSDLPNTHSEKFIYADDICLISQSVDFETSEITLENDLKKMDEYFQVWRLKPNAMKTETACFHLNNKQAHFAPRISFRNQMLRYNPEPKYLGVTLDRTLTFRAHLEKTACKIKTRNNIIQKLTGNGWGTNALTLRTSALALVYPVAEYCSPTWLNSAHTRAVDTQLNNTMRLISGTIKSTPTQWLPVLSNIHPPHLRRQLALKKEWQKCLDNRHLPIHQDRISQSRLRSRKPSWKVGESLVRDNFNIDDAWRREWSTSNPDANNLIKDPTQRPAGFELPRRYWTSLNRFRTGHGNCHYWRHKWGVVDRPDCDCGHNIQTLQHIATECPLRKFQGTFQDLHSLKGEAITWLKGLDIHP